MVKQMQIGGFTVHIERKHIKNINMHLRRRDGAIMISAPEFVSDQELTAFVEQHRCWLEKHIHAFAERSLPQPSRYQTGEAVYLWGRMYQLEVRTRSEPMAALRVKGTKLILEICPSSPEQRAQIIEKWQRRNLEAAIPSVLSRCEKRTGLEAKEWHIKRMKTRWGTCNVQAKRIWLSLSLASYPPQCLELVIIHELVHLLEPSHNKRFYQLMDCYYPSWREAEALLKHPMAGKE